MGNIASLAEGRAIIRKSFAQESETYHPQDTVLWNDALEKWRKMKK